MTVGAQAMPPTNFMDDASISSISKKDIGAAFGKPFLHPDQTKMNR
jgi:hypothetical protein